MDNDIFPGDQPGPGADSAMSPPAPPSTATPPDLSSDAATVSRHLYTLTVEDVAARLLEYGIDRDRRTIQRWCKSGKLRAIVDRENADRYLIEPTSLTDTVAALLAEQERQAAALAGMTHDRRDTSATPDGGVVEEPISVNPKQDDRDDDTVATAIDGEEVSRPDGENIAAPSRRVLELEREVVMLKADKQVREGMIDFIQEKFDQMLEQALDRTEQLGELKAENRHLRELLPPRAGQGGSEQGTLSFRPRSVTDDFTPSPET